jgi:integrase
VKDKGNKKGLRRFKQFEKKKDADAYRIKVEGEVVAGVHVPHSESATVADAAKLWIEYCEGEKLEASTVKQYKEHIKHHIDPFLGSVKLADLTRPRVESYRDALVKTRSREMARKVVVSLKSLLSDAVRRGLAPYNAASTTKVSKPKVDEREEEEVEIPAKSEIRGILAKSAELWGSPMVTAWRALIVTAAFTGCRLSELRGLHWDTVDFEKGCIEVKKRADFKGNLGAPKSKKGIRKIPLAPMVANTLKQWKLACPKTTLNLVFPHEGEIPSSSAVYKSCWFPLLRALDLMERRAARGTGNMVEAPRYTFHCLRHVAASLFIEQGWKPKRVQEVMGHASIQITYDIYGHLWPDHDNDQEAMRQIETRLLQS